MRVDGGEGGGFRTCVHAPLIIGPIRPMFRLEIWRAESNSVEMGTSVISE